MKLVFITTNKHKVEEVTTVLAPLGIEIEQKNIDYAEDRDDTIQNIAKKAAKQLAEELKMPVMVEDTGIFFTAYPAFPGAAPKFAYNALGYEGLLKLLEGKTGKERGAYFLSCIGYCEPGKEPVTFEGKLSGTINDHVEDRDMDIMPYERIFIADGDTKTLSKLSRDEKNAISHRSKAVLKLAEYLKDR